VLGRDRPGPGEGFLYLECCRPGRTRKLSAWHAMRMSLSAVVAAVLITRPPTRLRSTVSRFQEDANRCGVFQRSSVEHRPRRVHR
jgi:hypothetical protein